jgi:LacI family transcriptional regulator
MTAAAAGSGATRIAAAIPQPTIPIWSNSLQTKQENIMSTWYQTRTLVAALALAVAFSAHAAEHMFRERRVDGVIALPFARLEDSPFDEPAGSAFPLATIDLGTGQPCPFVAMDVRPGLAAAVAHLRERGHRRLMWLTPRLGRAAPSADRLIALRTAVRDANMQVCAIPLTVASETVCGNYDDNQPQVLEAIRRKLPRPLEATAVLCWNDYLAHCLCAVLRERGLRIPHDVSVIGFDDVRPMFHVPPLSTVSGAFRQLGGAAAQLVLRMARGELPPAEAREARVSVPTFFIARGSSGAALSTGAGSRT